jgi:PAS domain S-box-containing protein
MAATTLLRWALDPFLEEHHPFVLFLLPVLFAAWFGSWRQALLAVAVGYLLADFFFVHPRRAPGIEGVEHQMGAVIYVSVSAVAIAMSQSVRSARRRAESQSELLRAEVGRHEHTQGQLREANARLEHRVEERTAQLSHANIHLQDEETARRDAEARSRRLASLVASSEDAIIGLDPDCNVTDWNVGAEHLFGTSAEEISGRSIFVLIPPDDLDTVNRKLARVRSGEPVEPYEAVRLRKDGDRVPVSVRLSAVPDEAGGISGYSLIYRDLTHARRLEDKVRQSQKMDAIGQLAGGVAHDFNNILTVINGYSEILMGKFRHDESTRGLVKQVHEAGVRAASLTNQLLAFSRKQVLQPQVVDLNRTVRQTEKMLCRLIGEDVSLATVLEPALAHVKVDHGQFEQVIMNLAVNSRDAMPAGGKLTIETSNVELDEAYAEAHPEAWPGRYVLLAVSDTGTGMDAATKARVFEPFFTTKGVGKGTGLGLSMVHGIVKQSGGHVALYTEPGHGTVFKIYLPAVEGLHAPRVSHEEVADSPKGAETILLVEDEEAVRRLTRMTLEGSGYKVLEASHGGEAVRLAEQYGGPIHLLVSDVVMPEMGGRILSERLTASRPGLKVVFLSGYTDDAVVRHGVIESGTAFVQKPFSPGALARKVREVLDGTTIPTRA